MSDALVDRIRMALELEGATDEDAWRVIAAARGLWRELAHLGMVDSPDSVEFERVLPIALATIQHEANKGPNA